MNPSWRKKALCVMTLPLQGILAACSAENDCARPLSDNLFENPRFEASEHREHARWGAVQHAGKPAYRVTVNDGVLTIDKIDRQPWFAFRQTIRIPDRAGQYLQLSAEIRLDMTEDPEHAFEQGGGLSLAFRGRSSSRSNTILLSSVLDHEPRLGRTDWTPVAVTLAVPPGAETVTAGFLHQANGMLEIRNPALRFVTEPCGEDKPRKRHPEASAGPGGSD